MSEKLKPCPCCGGYPAIYGVAKDNKLVWKLRLGKEWSNNGFPDEFPTREEAHIAWNRRVENGKS